MGGKLTKIFLPCNITTESSGWKMDSVAADFGPRRWLAGTFWNLLNYSLPSSPQLL